MECNTMEVASDSICKWPQIPFDKRIIPNDMIRSSLFTVSNHNAKREYFKNKKLASFASTEMIYTGEELRQDDEDVWLEIIYLASVNETNVVTVRPYELMRRMGWPQRTQYKDKLKNSLARMSATSLQIYNSVFKEGLGVSLIRKFMWYEDGNSLKEWKIFLEPELVRLFGALGKEHTKVVLEQRSKLKPLAKWLHAYYSSHAEPIPTNIIRLHQLSGSRMKTLKHFKASLRESLVELIQVRFLEPDIFIDAKNFVHVARARDSYKYLGNNHRHE